MIDNRASTLQQKLRVQRRVIWALTMREVITRFGREGLGAFWLIAEPAMFIVGVLLIISHLEQFNNYSVAEYLAVSYPTVLFWRNGTNRSIKALEINRALLHHHPIRPMDVIYSRILLEFSGGAASFAMLYPALVLLRVCHWPNDWLIFISGYLLVIWFSFSFVLIMVALSELSETIEKLSHIILYFMIPFSGVFLPLYAIPSEFRSAMMLFPLIDFIEFFHKGYYGASMPTYYHLPPAMLTTLALTLLGYALANIAIRRVQTDQ